MSQALKGKVALVTGGSRGIGAAIAKRLAADGADVIISYSASPDRAAGVVKDIENSGARGFAIKADQADGKQVEALVTEAVKKFGRLDILVNNAGVYETSAVTDTDTDLAALRRQLAINVEAVATAVRTAVPHLPEGGRIISIGSVLGERIAFPGVADYGATKAAVAAYTKGWARDLGLKGIRVNTVQPGPIDTEMNPADGEFADHVKAMVPLGRYGKAEEIAGAVAFLAGPDATYISGTTLTVDGGLNA